MKIRFSLYVLALLLVIPVSISAAPPAYVTGLSATYENGKINLSWTPQPNEDINYYIIYYSFESILDNDGLFDDFIQTTNADPSFIFDAPAGYTDLYLAVSAVSPAGEKGDLLTEEILVNIPDTSNNNTDLGQSPFDNTVPEDNTTDFPALFDDSTSPNNNTTTNENLIEESNQYQIPDPDNTLPTTTEPLPTQNPPIQEQPFTPTKQEPETPTTLSLLSAKAVSPTEVLLEFSAPITVDPDRATDAFTIKDAGGAPLQLVQMYIEGTKATITTVEQERGKVYEFIVSEPAYNPDGLPLDPTAYKAFFTGHKEGKEPNTSEIKIPPPPTVNVGPLQGVDNFKITSAPQADGLYSLTISWDVVGDRNEIAKYVFYQTRDGGITFSAPQVTEANISGINIPNNQPGPLGITMAILKTDGQTFVAAQDTINIGKSSSTQSQSSSEISSVLTPPPKFPSVIQSSPNKSPKDNKNYTQTESIKKKPSDNKSNKLSDTGPAAAVLIAIGSATGWISSKRRKVRKGK